MSTVAVVQRANPYIGPRSFRRDEALYGRDREVQELLDLIIAERIVLLYSPSGAGKTSLVQAALVPALERESFTVHPIMRVSRRFEQELAPGTHCNRYVLSALSDLEEALPKEQQRSPAQLAAMSFDRYLEQALPAGLVASPNGSGGASEVFIFDQFEEILTIDPADLDAKRELFAQLGRALRDRRRWALFSMREDYIAGLDPYLRTIPTRLATTYRLDLLGDDAARQAIQKPVQNMQAGIEFSDSAAKQLVDNLRRIRVQCPDGSFEEQLGPYVEPVQLQVVCSNLWQKLPPGTTQITGANVKDVGDVDTALADYYAESVKSVASSDKTERAIREWFEHHLITEQGIRGQVLQGQNSSEGLDNAVVYALVDAHLVRAEKRHGATWFELAHDRLIEPVQDDNSRWLEAHLSKVQKLAAVWEAQGRPDGLQLLGKDLVEAKQWAAANQASLTDVERKFLQASEAKQEAIWREQRQTKRLRAALGIASLLLIAAVVAVGFALWSQHEAENRKAEADRQETIAQIQTGVARGEAASLAKANEHLSDAQHALSAEVIEANQEKATAVKAAAEARKQTQMALSRQLAAQAEVEVRSSPRKALLMAVESAHAAQLGNRVVYHEAAQLFHRLLGQTGGTPIATGNIPASAVGVSPAGHWFAYGYSDGTIQLIDLSTPKGTPRQLKKHLHSINTIAFSANERWLASEDDNDTVLLWDLENEAAAPTSLRGHGRSPPHTIAFSPDNRRLAVTTNTADSGSVQIYDLPVRKPEWNYSVENPPAKGGWIEAVAFNHDGNQLAFTSSSGIWVCKLPSTEPPNASLGERPLQLEQTQFTKSNGWERGLTFSPDGHWLAYGEGSDVLLVDPRNATRRITLRGLSAAIEAISFSADSEFVAAGGDDFTAGVWALDQPNTPIILRGHEDRIFTLSFNHDSRSLITGTKLDGGRRWTLPDASPDRILLQRTDKVSTDLGTKLVGFSPDGRWLAAGGDGHGKLWLWNLAAPTLSATSIGPCGSNAISWLIFSQKTKWLAAATWGNNVVCLWSLENAPAKPPDFSRSVTGEATSLAFSPDGLHVAAGTWEGRVVIWDLNTKSPVQDSVVSTGSPVRALKFSRNGKLLATGGAVDAQIWDITNDHMPVRRAMLRGFNDWVGTLAFSADGRFFSAGSWDDSAPIWNIENPEKPEQFGTGLRFGDRVVTESFSPDSRWLALGIWDDTVRLVDLKASDQHALVLRGHTRRVLDLAFSPDGHELASIAEDSTARIWDMDDVYAAPIILAGHQDALRGGAFSPDGRWYATISEDRTIRLWDLCVEDLVRLACQTSGRNLSVSEWKELMGSKKYRSTCPDLPPGSDDTKQTYVSKAASDTR